MIEISKLANGMTVITDPMPGIESTAIGVWVNSGTRHETPREMGLAHVLEHMAFKGTARRTARDIAEQIEAVGGDINAYTGRETTAYHARVLKEDVPLILDVLADVLIHSTFDAEELARERDVIVQEIGSARDTPDDLVFDFLQEACYPDQPMGWPILGSEKTVQSFQQADIRRYIAAQYHPKDMVLSAAGAVDHAQLVTLAHDLFQSLISGETPPVEPARYVPGDKRENDDLEQAHLTFAFPGVPSGDSESMTANLFTTALGGGMSSRLFQEVREKRGLCYSISAYPSHYRDTGTIGVYCGTSPDKAGEIAPLVVAEIEGMATSASEDEIGRAKAIWRASLLMGLESPHTRAERAAGQWFVYGRVLSSEEMIGRVQAVDAAGVRRFASRLLERGEPAMAAVGPVKNLESLERFARRFGTSKAA